MLHPGTLEKNQTIVKAEQKVMRDSSWIENALLMDF